MPERQTETSNATPDRHMPVLGILFSALILVSCTPDNQALVNQNIRANPVVLSDLPAESALSAMDAIVVFVNRMDPYSSLVTVAYTHGAGSFHEFHADTNVAFPSISPDGRYVAFSTELWGSEQSKAYVRSLTDVNSPPIEVGASPAFAPVWWVDPSTSDTFVIFASSIMGNDDSAWRSTTTQMQEIKGGVPSGKVIPIINQGSYYGGISGEGNILGTGYPRLLIYDRSSGAINQLFLSPWNGKGPDGSTQCCNASLCPVKASRKILFLDFGYDRPGTIISQPYMPHEYIFVCSTDDGKVLKWFHCPSGEVEWQNTKWSNSEDFATACVIDRDMKRHAVYIVNMADSAYIKVAEGIDLWQPSLWIGPK